MCIRDRTTPLISEMTRFTLANIPTLLSILRRTMMLLLALNGGWLTVMIYSRNKWLRLITGLADRVFTFEFVRFRSLI